MVEAVGDHETDIGAQFRSVLAKERDCLADVTGPGDLMLWRLRLVRELMDCRSPYALSVRHGQDADNQGEFLRCWQSHLAEALQRVVIERRGAASVGTARAPGPSIEDPGYLALSILAALHGGVALSRLAGDRRSLEAALDLALAPVVTCRDADASGCRSFG